MNEYLQLFIDEEYPYFIDKYLDTKTLNRLKYVTQFCGCDYTDLYSPLFLYTRYDHSLVVAHMTWHFTHNKKETIAALLHDVGTPCFAHCIDYVFGDYLKQETSEKKITDIIKQDKDLLMYLKEDNISLEDLESLKNYPILENKSPKLCTDRLDGVLHTCYIWLHINSLEEIMKIYNNLDVLTNEWGNKEIGFNNLKVAEEFVSLVYTYAKELQGNTDKYIMKYISEIVKLSFEKRLLSLEDLYTKKESDLVKIFSNNFSSWEYFNKASNVIGVTEQPDNFYISFNTKKRNTIPLVNTSDSIARIINVSNYSRKIYSELENYQDTEFAYVKTIKRLY